MHRFIEYLKATRAELAHVAWPTRQQAIVYTTLVIIVSVIVAAFTGALDFVFTGALNWLLG